MLDGVSLDQLRTFVAAAEEGNFTAAGRRLRRAQSVVSQTLANLEGQIGVKLFNRSGRVPTLTDKGHALLAGARTVAKEVDRFKARPCRARPTHACGSFQCVAHRETRAAVPKSVASSRSRRHASLSSRRSRVWHAAAAHGAGRSDKWRACGDSCGGRPTRGHGYQ